MRARPTQISFRLERWRAPVCVLLALVLAVGGGCFSGDEGEQFYGRVSPPRVQEFRWSDGGLPRIFDPARASAPPDTDAVRALFEGLTELDPQSLEAVAGVAARWESSEGDRVWTFHLRGDARWSNGDRVTAHDFVRAWRRTLRLGEDAPHARLLSNVIERAKPAARAATLPPARAAASPAGGGTGRAQSAAGGAVRPQSAAGESESRAAGEAAAGETSNGVESASTDEEPKLGAEALDEQTLRVRLQRPDKNFPALVAHPVFRPVHASAAGGAEGEGRGLAAESGAGGAVADARSVITNGAFRLSELGADGVVLERESHYWNAAQVALERVRFVGAADAEAALSAYRAGEVDAVTNANVEPLGLKLLASYKDFRRTTFGALTYYDINATRPPFDDVRVRRALALAIDRQRLSADTLEGATEPAGKFLPVAGGEGARGDGPGAMPGGAKSDGDGAGAKSAGGGAGDGNKAGPGAGEQKDGAGESARGQATGARDTNGQGASGQSVSGQGADGQVAGGLNGDGQGADEGDAAGAKEGSASGLRFDPARARRLLAEAGYAGGAGFPRVRLLVNRNDQHRAVAEAVAWMWRTVLGVETEIMLREWGEYEMLLRTGEFDVAKRSLIMQTPDEEANMLLMFDPERLNFDAAAIEANAAASPAPAEPQASPAPADERRADADAPTVLKSIFTESQALREVPAIPVYFASSYALVKPYVRGFDANLLDAPSLQRVRIDTGWQPPRRETLLTPAGPAGR